MADQQTDTKQIPWYRGLTGYHWLVLFVACCGWAFDTMDQWLYVLAKGPALKELMQPVITARGIVDPVAAGDLTKYYTGIVQMIFVIGWATGGFIFGMIGDRLGRTRTMAITVIMYAGFTGMCSIAHSWQSFALFRFLVGLGVGGEFAAGAALVAEAFPHRSRATALGIMQAASAVGNVTAGFIGSTIGANMGWRWVFAIGVIPALLVFIIQVFLKEPEAWQEAQQAAKAAGGAGKGKAMGSLREMFGDPTLRRNTLVGMGLAAVGVMGFWGINTFSPELLRTALQPLGLSQKAMEQRTGWAVMAQNSGAFFGILLWAYLAQKIGRKPTFALSFIACLIVVPLTFHLTTSFGRALVLFPVMGFCITSLFGGYSVYFPELYPTRLRATGTGFCYNSARYLAAGAPYMVGYLTTAAGSIAWAATIVSVIFIFGLLILPFAPETMGKPLPE